MAVDVVPCRRGDGRWQAMIQPALVATLSAQMSWSWTARRSRPETPPGISPDLLVRPAFRAGAGTPPGISPDLLVRPAFRAGAGTPGRLHSRRV